MGAEPVPGPPGAAAAGAGSTLVGLRLGPDDDVAVVTADVAPGDVVAVGPVTATAADAIGRGHKIALRALRPGDPVHKYGQVIGFATAPIAPGMHVHTQNLEFRVFARDQHVGVDVRPTVQVDAAQRRTFDGIIRADGRVATRNYLGVLSSVNCSATVAKAIAGHFTRPGVLDDYPGVDGVVALTHASGCGMDAAGDGRAVLARTLGGYANHPNLAGVLLVGLGCEVNQVDALAGSWSLPPEALHVMTIQGQGGTRATVAEGIDRLGAMLPGADQVARRPVPVSNLVLGLQCGGSDAFSGITANPALGVAADLLVAEGGTVILGETPEIYGAEHLLARRAVNADVAERLVERIRWWGSYTAANHGSMDNNPSPGNKAGGLTTILEKSLGAVAKAGSTALVGVCGYAEAVVGPGLVFMDTPGYDPVSVTGMVAGGANVVCFTTGRGSVFGCKPVPSLKLATTTALYERMGDDMDIDCGVIATGEASIEDTGQRIFDALIATASGTPTRSEVLGFGDEEFVPWQLGAEM
ncbi:MAG: UxaA family hydrolase [Acidimicrobiales bacterium]